MSWELAFYALMLGTLVGGAYLIFRGRKEEKAILECARRLRDELRRRGFDEFLECSGHRLCVAFRHSSLGDQPVDPREVKAAFFAAGCDSPINFPGYWWIARHYPSGTDDDCSTWHVSFCSVYDGHSER